MTVGPRNAGGEAECTDDHIDDHTLTYAEEEESPASRLGVYGGPHGSNESQIRMDELEHGSDRDSGRSAFEPLHMLVSAFRSPKGRTMRDWGWL